MTDRELNITLRELARSQGLCDEWFKAWGDDSTIDECLGRYIKGFDFVQEHDYPPLEFIRAHFGKDVLHRHNIYLDEEVSVTDAHNGYYVFLGRCKGRIAVDGLKVVTVYVRHDSVIDVVASHGSKVFVTYYDNSNGTCASDSWSKCRRYNRQKADS